MKQNMFRPFIDKSSWDDNPGSVGIHVEVKPYNLKELCFLYNMSYKTLRKSLKPLKNRLGKKAGYYFNVRQVEMIFNELGIPYSINQNN